MPRTSRRDELTRAALELFVEHGYDGTSVADIAGAVGVSKAAVSYHFPAKDDLLLALAGPLLDRLEGLVGGLVPPLEPDAIRPFLDTYADVLLAEGELATWLDADRGVLTHPVVGARVTALHDATRRLLGGDDSMGQLAAASALGALWRPIRNLAVPTSGQRDLLVDAAIGALTSVSN